MDSIARLLGRKRSRSDGVEESWNEYENSLHSDAARLVTRTFQLKAIEIDRRIQTGITLSPWVSTATDAARHMSMVSDQPYRKRLRTEQRDPLTPRITPLEIFEMTEVTVAAQPVGRAKSGSRSTREPNASAAVPTHNDTTPHEDSPSPQKPTFNLSTVDSAARGLLAVETELKEEVKVFLRNLSTVKRSMQLRLCEPKLNPVRRDMMNDAMLDVDAIENQLSKLLVDRKRCFENRGAILARLLEDPRVFDWKVSLKEFDDLQCTGIDQAWEQLCQSYGILHKRLRDLL
ncbi:hypothetical protein BJ742DRAFT_800918 [Cladochytrium replicatum]|nr:hypothetical protein BJ742DRAFT_800918 [Cladochytrium replicatum]